MHTLVPVQRTFQCWVGLTELGACAWAMFWRAQRGIGGAAAFPVQHAPLQCDVGSSQYALHARGAPTPITAGRAPRGYCVLHAPRCALLSLLEPQNTMSLCITPYSDCCSLHVHVCCVQDFLHAGQVLCIAVDKTGQEERVVLPEAHTLTELPLVSWQ